MTLIVAIIPARFDSSRFPGKPLTLINGKAMISHVYEGVHDSDLCDKVLVATDDKRIAAYCDEQSLNYKITSVDHLSGTDRISEVASDYHDDEIIINIQGDEPLINAKILSDLISLFDDEKCEIASLMSVSENEEEWMSDSVVKVVVDEDQYAVSFFRSSDETYDQGFYKHIGLYGFRARTLARVVGLHRSEREVALRLEQWRWMDNGYRIKMGITNQLSHGVDVPEDIEVIERLLEERIIKEQR